MCIRDRVGPCRHWPFGNRGRSLRQSKCPRRSRIRSGSRRAAPRGYSTPGGRNYRRMALMVQPALPGGAATRVARPRPLRRQVGVWDECVFRGACPGLESRGGVRASNMQCKPKYPKPACLLCLRIASLPEQSAGRLLGPIKTQEIAFERGKKMARECVVHNTYTPFFVFLAGFEPGTSQFLFGY